MPFLEILNEVFVASIFCCTGYAYLTKYVPYRNGYRWVIFWRVFKNVSLSHFPYQLFRTS